MGEICPHPSRTFFFTQKLYLIHVTCRQSFFQITNSENNRMDVEVTVNHTSSSTNSAHRVVISDQSSGFKIDEQSISASPAGLLSLSFLSSSRGLRAEAELFSLTEETILISYSADALADEQFPYGVKNNTVLVEYQSSPMV